MLSIDEILFFKKDIEILKNWDIKKPLFITGGSGVGKSTLAKLIFKEKNITTNNVDSASIKKGKCVSEYILDVLGKCSISMMFSSNSINGLIIDDLDVFDSQDNIITSIYSIIKNNKTTSPIILVCNNKFISSNISKIMNITYVLNVSSPSVQRMCKVKHTATGQVIQRCAKKSQGDWSYFLRLLCVSHKKDKLIDIDEKIVSGNITEHTKYLMNYTYDINNLSSLCSSDYSLLTLMLYTNVTQILQNNNLPLNNIYKSIQLFDIVEKNIENDWSMIDLSIFFGCVRPLYEIKDIYTGDLETKYTHVFSVSTSQINHRKLLKKVEKETGKNINILAALLYQSIKNDIAYKKCKELNLKEFTLNELQKIIITYYKPCKFTVGNKKILNSFL